MKPKQRQRIRNTFAQARSLSQFTQRRELRRRSNIVYRISASRLRLSCRARFAVMGNQCGRCDHRARTVRPSKATQTDASPVQCLATRVAPMRTRTTQTTSTTVEQPLWAMLAEEEYFEEELLNYSQRERRRALNNAMRADRHRDAREARIRLEARWAEQAAARGAQGWHRPSRSRSRSRTREPASSSNW